MKKTTLLCLAAVVGAFALNGCASQAPAAKMEMLYVDPSYSQSNIKTVAVLPLSNTTGEADVDKILGNSIEAQLATRTDYTFMTAERLQRKCSAAGLSPDLESLRRQWVHTREFKPDLSRKIASELGVDAFLVGQVTKWEKVDLRAEQTGYPSSTVGCRLLLMDARTGNRLWEASREKITKGQYYDPSQQEVTQYMDQAGIVRGSGGKPVQTIEAPPIREVADQVAIDLVKAIPAGSAEQG
jgi:hypothetical protein